VSVGEWPRHVFVKTQPLPARDVVIACVSGLRQESKVMLAEEGDLVEDT